MKKNIRKPTHTGNQPIRVLKHNLTTRLVERNENYINNLLSDFKLSKSIRYNIADLALNEKQCPDIDDEGIINIHETYLSYIWINCYFFFVLHEELLVIPDAKSRGLPYRKEQNIQLYEKARELFDYGISLIKVYSKWDIDYYPNPEYFDESNDEGWYILRTNDLYVETLNFILYHETSHAELEHIKKTKGKTLLKEDYVKLEYEADIRAIELMLFNARKKESTELAIAISLATILFFKNNLSGGNKHPNIDERLENAIAKLNPQNDSPIWSLLCLFLKEWSTRFELNVNEGGHYENYKELYYELISQIKNCCEQGV